MAKGLGCALLDSGDLYCWGAIDELPLNSTAVTATVGNLAKVVGYSGKIVDYVSPWEVLIEGGVMETGAFGGTAPEVVSLGGVALSILKAGSSNTCALLASGELKCWGLNSVGQLGNVSHYQSTVSDTNTNMPDKRTHHIFCTHCVSCSPPLFDLRATTRSNHHIELRSLRPWYDSQHLLPLLFLFNI